MCVRIERYGTRRAAVEEHVETAVASRRVVSYIRMAEIRGEREKEDGIEQRTPSASTCLFMCVYECDEGCIQSSVLPSCIEQILILKAYLFARPDASLPCPAYFLLRQPFQTLYFKSRDNVYP